MNRQAQGYLQPRSSNKQGGPANIQHQYQTYNPQVAADVGQFGSGGAGTGRVSQFATSVAGGPPANSVQVSQSSGLRAQQPTSHAPVQSHHSVIHHPHTVLSSGTSAGVQQQVGPQGTTQVATHELNTQAIQQGTAQQMQQVHGVIQTAAQHPIMYSSNNHNAPQQQGPQQPNQMRRIVNGQGQYYPHAQPNPAVIHGTQQQRQVLTTTPTQQMHNYHQPFMVAAHPHHPQLLTSANQSLYHNQAAMYNAALAAQHRTSSTNAQPQFGMVNQHPQAGYIQSYSQMQQSPAIFYNQPQTTAVKPTPAPAPTQRERRAIPIIDPSTNKNILEDLSDASKPSEPSSPAPSRDSSASTTPAPGSIAAPIKSNDIPAQFALQVTQAATGSEDISANSDKTEESNRKISISANNDSNILSNSELNNDSRDVNCRIINSSCVTSGEDVSPNVPEINNVNKQPSKYSTQATPPQSLRPNKQTKNASNEQVNVQSTKSKTFTSTKDNQQKDSYNMASKVAPNAPQPASPNAPQSASPIAPSPIAMNMPLKTEDVAALPVNIQHSNSETLVSPPHLQKTMGYPPPSMPRQGSQAFNPNRFVPPFPANFQSPPPPIEQPTKEPQQVLSDNVNKEVKETPPVHVATPDSVAPNKEDSKLILSSSPKALATILPTPLEDKKEESTEASGKRGKEKSEDGNQENPSPSDEVCQTETPKDSAKEVEKTPVAAPEVVAKNVIVHPVEVPVVEDSQATKTSMKKKKSQSESTVPSTAAKTIPDEVVEMNLKNSNATLAAPVEEDDADRKFHYDRQSLIDISKCFLSQKRPDCLPNLEVVLDGPHKQPIKQMPTKAAEDFTPLYLQNNSNRGRPGGHNPYVQQKAVGRNSQQGRRVQKVIDIKLSSSSEIKLKTSENAWKPASKKPASEEASSKDEQEAKLEELKKKMRGILNKLTPDNFEKLVLRVKTFPIENYDHLDGIIGLIFEKAVDEQGFSTTYAQLCQVLSLMSVKDSKEVTGKQEKAEKIKEARFRNLIINKCQKEFERDTAKDITLVEMKRELDNCSPDKKVELAAIYNYEETKLRKRSVGNIRFIGELYKLKMLTSPIMMKIIASLLEKKDEESLECLCKLLTTIGQMLETSANSSSNAKVELAERFKNMNAIVNEKKTSSRVRFLLMDVLDLRKNNWVPRREVTKPKTKAEVHEEIRKEDELMQHQILMQSTTNTPRRMDDRERRRARGGMPDDGGWNTVGPQMNTRRIPLDTNRISKTFNRVPEGEVTFRGGFSNWARGSSGGAGAAGANSQEDISNRYNVLENHNQMTGGDQRRANAYQSQRFMPGGNGNGNNRQGGGYGSKSMPPPSEKETVARFAIKKAVTPNDRSKSNSRSSSRDRTWNRDKDVPKVPMSEDDAKIALKEINDLLSSTSNYEELANTVRETYAPHSLALFVQIFLDTNIDKNLERRKLSGKFYQYLFIHKILCLDDFIEGTKEYLGLIEDLMIDIPRIREYLGDVFGYLLVDGAMKVEELAKVLGNVICSHRPSVFAAVLKVAEKEFGPTLLSNMLNRPSFDWSSILPEGVLPTQFLTDNSLTFNMDASPKPVPKISDPIKIRKELLDMLKRGSSDDKIFGWIEMNVAEISADFVRALTTALVESLMIVAPDGNSLVVGDNFLTNLKNKVKIVHKYVDNKEHLELPCLYGIQSLCVENQHPPGMMENCFNAFYDQEVLSEDSFTEWEESKDPKEQLGKGVCVTSVSKFLSWIKETVPEEIETTVSTSDQGAEQLPPN